MARPSTPSGSFVYVIGKSRLGNTLAAASTRGICMLAFADRRADLIEDLARRFPGATPASPRHPAMPMLRRALKFPAAPWRAPRFPVDLHGTTFQRSVWRALLRIPFGKTASYRDIAQAIGSPKAVRAVAGACGANPVALVIPCHRIVHRDGSISGYRWGVDRKRKLLSLEARHATRKTLRHS